MMVGDVLEHSVALEFIQTQAKRVKEQRDNRKEGEVIVH